MNSSRVQLSLSTPTVCMCVCVRALASEVRNVPAWCGDASWRWSGFRAAAQASTRDRALWGAACKQGRAQSRGLAPAKTPVKGPARAAAARGSGRWEKHGKDSPQTATCLAAAGRARARVARTAHRTAQSCPPTLAAGGAPSSGVLARRRSANRHGSVMDLQRRRALRAGRHSSHGGRGANRRGRHRRGSGFWHCGHRVSREPLGAAVATGQGR